MTKRLRHASELPVGCSVRWNPEYSNKPWVGVVTAHLTATMVECDGQGGLSVGLLERIDPNDPPAEPDELTRLRAEIDALTEVIAMQMEIIDGR